MKICLNVYMNVLTYNDMYVCMNIVCIYAHMYVCTQHLSRYLP